MARAAVVGSPWLEEFALRHCARVVVIPSCLDTARYSPRTESAGKPLVIGWIGSRSGFTYLHALDDVWRELHRRHGTLFRVVSNGEYRADGFEIENVAWSLEGEVAALQSFDIGVMPLSDTPFERGQAGFKLLQCMAVGVPAVASPIGVNQEIAGNEQSGAQLRALLASTSEGWTAALERLIADPALRRRMGEAGRAHVLKHYDIGCAVNAWDALLREVAGK
jgi:glycosyltransferase involved in cell wall biosynthesis